MNGTVLMRYGIGAAIGAVVAVSLLWVMQFLIETGKDALSDNKRPHFMDFVRVERDQAVERKDRKPKKPPAPEEQPPDLPQPQQEQVNPQAESIYVAPVGIDGGAMDIASSFGLEASDGEYLPIVKVAPIYPRRAAERGITGTCMVMYTVSTAGTVKDVQVVEGHCENSVFERPSVEAALRFKYKPRVIDGTAVEVRGVYNRFYYEQEE